MPQFPRLGEATNTALGTHSVLPLEREDLEEARRIFAACGEAELAGADLEPRFEQGALFNDETQSFVTRVNDAPVSIAIVNGLEQPIPRAKLYLPPGADDESFTAANTVRWLADCFFSMRWYTVAAGFVLVPARRTANGELTQLVSGGASAGELEISRADWEGWDRHPVRDHVGEVPSGGTPLAESQVSFTPFTEEWLPFLQRIMLSSFEFYNFRPVNRQRLEHWFREREYFGDKNRYFTVLAEGEPAGIVRVESVMSHAPEVGVRLLGPWQSRGVGLHATRFVVDYAFTGLPRPAHKVRALTATANTGGNKALRKFGFTLEGVSRQQWYIRGRWRDAAMYSLLRSEWDQFS